MKIFSVPNLSPAEKNLVRTLSEMPTDIAIEEFEEAVGYLGDWDCDCGKNQEQCFVERYDGKSAWTCPTSEAMVIRYYIETLWEARQYLYFEGPLVYRTIEPDCCFRLHDLFASKVLDVEKIKIHIDFEDCSKYITVWGPGLYRSPDPVIDKEIVQYGYV